MQPDVQIDTDGKTVWVNSALGMCLGRFSKHGVDVPGQLAGVQCLDCIHGLPPRESWDRFVASMRQHHGVVVSGIYAPDFVPKS